MGRPSFKPTPEQTAQVAAWVQAKVSIEEMSRRLELASKTFRKHFADQLGISRPDPVITEVAAPQAAARPAFRPTSEQREAALILAGAQLSRPEIAHKMGMAVEMLEEHFAEELAQGPVKCKADILTAMFHAGKGGNVAAAKVYLIFNGQEPRQADDDAGQQPAAIGLLGKKQAAAVGAQTAEQGTGWEDLVGPSSSGKPN